MQETETVFDPLRGLRVREVADRLGSSERHVWRLIAAGKLDTIRIGRLRRVTARSLRALFDGKAAA